MEFGNRQGAFVQQRVGVDTGRKDAFGHKAIHEFAALVVTHIDNDMAVLVDHTFGIFVLEAAQSGALLRGGVRITRIDLDHITGAVRLLRGAWQRQNAHRSLPSRNPSPLVLMP